MDINQIMKDKPLVHDMADCKEIFWINPQSDQPAKLPFTMADTALCGLPMAFARRYWLIPMGTKNSSSNTSPGVETTLSVVVTELYLPRLSVFPPEAKAPLVVDPDAALTKSVALQTLEPVAGRGL